VCCSRRPRSATRSPSKRPWPLEVVNLAWAPDKRNRGDRGGTAGRAVTRCDPVAEFREGAPRTSRQV
jgi:hypothetical protein